MRSRLAIALGALLVGIVLGFGVAFAVRRSAPPAASVDSAAVVAAVTKIARLATIEIQVADIVKYEEIKTIAVVFDVPKNATLRVRGRVLGGFDLASGTSVTADAASKTVHVSLPAPRVLAVDETVEWFDERSGWLNPITPADRTRWTAWAKAALSRSAKDAGLLAKATDNARELVAGAAGAFGWKADVTIASEPRL